MKFLKIIKNELEQLYFDYQFKSFVCDELPAIYWVGDYSETPTNCEDSKRYFTFTLTGTTTGTYSALEEKKEIIYKLFAPYEGGKRYETDDGGAVIIEYENAFNVDTDDENLKRIQINLSILEWGI